MNLFQWIVLSLLASVLVVELFVSSRRSPSWFRLVRILAWTLAGGFVADPMILQRVAQWIGIGRGADVVLYVSVLIFLSLSFFFYARCLDLQRQITELTRAIAINNAKRNDGNNDT